MTPQKIEVGNFTQDSSKEQSVENVKAMLMSIIEIIDGRYAEEGFVPVKMVCILEDEDVKGKPNDWRAWCNGTDSREAYFMAKKMAHDCLLSEMESCGVDCYDGD